MTTETSSTPPPLPWVDDYAFYSCGYYPEGFVWRAKFAPLPRRSYSNQNIHPLFPARAQWPDPRDRKDWNDTHYRDPVI